MTRLRLVCISLWFYFLRTLKNHWRRTILIPLYHYQPLQKHLRVSQKLTSENSPLHTASHCIKMSVFRVILVRIFPHSDRILKDTEYLSVFSPNEGKCGPIEYLSIFSPNERKCGPEWLPIWTFFTQWVTGLVTGTFHFLVQFSKHQPTRPSKLTRLSTMHPFSTLWKHQETLRLLDVFRR